MDVGAMVSRLIGVLLILASLASIYYGWKFENKFREMDIDDDWDMGDGGIAVALGGILAFVGLLLLFRVF